MPPAAPPRSPSVVEEQVRWSRGEMRIKVTEAVVYEHVAGYLEKDIVSKITQPIDKLIAQGAKPVIFNDWWELSGYDTDARLKLTDWIFWIRGKIVGSHILVRSKIVSMGVSIANLALGGMLTVYTDRQQFTLAYHRAVRQCVKVSSSPSIPAAIATPAPPPSVSPASSSSPSSSPTPPTPASPSLPVSPSLDPSRPPRSVR